MILASHQPNFLPYMGFFYKAARCDILVLSEDVAFSKSGMHNWNRIYTHDGVRKFTVPVSAHHDTPLCEVALVDPEYNLSKLAKTLLQEYRGAKHWPDGMDVVAQMVHMSKAPGLKMVDLNTGLIEFLLKKFGIKTKVTSSLELKIAGHKDERLFQMCERTGADTYLSGTGAKAYHDEDEYARRGINLVYTDYEPVVYPHIHGEFVENLSVIDYIFNQGFTLPEGWAVRG